MSLGWTKIAGACLYADVSKRTVRQWLRSGLRHSRLPSGRIFIRYRDIDKFLEQYGTTEQSEAAKLNTLAEEIVKELR